MFDPKWKNLSTVEFDRTVRRVCSRNEKLRFFSGKTGIYCFRCKKITPLRKCPACGDTEYETGTSSGYIGFYCVKCRKGFDIYVCPCGEKSRISSIMMKEKIPPGITEKAIVLTVRSFMFPFKAIWLLIYNLITIPIKLIFKLIKAPFVFLSETIEKMQLNSEADRKYREQSLRWTDIYYQKNPGWIGSGFPLRAVYELKTEAENGNKYALSSLESIFGNENRSEKKAEVAHVLKELTGNDYMTPDEIQKILMLSRMRLTPLPPAPDDLP